MAMSHHRRLPVLTALMGLMVAACPGTGTEIRDTPIMDEVRGTLIVDPEIASASIGGTVLGATGGEIKQGMATITAEMDTLVIGDIRSFGEGATARHETTCRGDTCILRPGFADAAGVVDETGLLSATNVSVEGSRFTPVMIYNGVRMVHEESLSSANVDSYGGWLDHHYFFIQFNIGEDSPATRLSYSAGSGSASAPAGDAVWRGAMIGVDVSRGSDHDAFVQGRADIRFALDTMTVDATFSDIVELSTGNPRRDMSWLDVPVTRDEFRVGAGADRIEGRFYGLDHAESGGVFERDLILGAFGASRVD